MPGIVYTNYRQSLVITGGRLLRWKNCELIDTMPDNSVVFVSATDIRTVKHRGVDTVYNRLRSLGAFLDSHNPNFSIRPVQAPMTIDKVCSSYIFCFIALILNNFAVFWRLCNFIVALQ